MKHVPRQSAAAAVVVAGAAGMAADAVVVAVDVAATVVVAGAAVIAATAEIAGKQGTPSLKAQRPSSGQGRFNPSQRILSGTSASIIHRCCSHLRRFNSSNPVER